MGSAEGVGGIPYVGVADSAPGLETLKADRRTKPLARFSPKKAKRLFIAAAANIPGRCEVSQRASVTAELELMCLMHCRRARIRW